MSARAVLRGAALPAAFAFAPLLVRVALLLKQRIALAGADVHGFVVDLLVGLALGAVTAPLFARTRYAGLLLLPWTALNYMSYEFTRTMNAVPPWQSIRFLGDGTFLKGSVIIISNPVLLVLLVLGAVSGAIWSWRRRKLPKPRALLRPIAAPLAAASLVALVWPTSRDTLLWRQTNFIAGNVVDIVRPSTKALPALSKEREAELDGLFRADLAGSTLLSPSAKRPNVLFVLLESISGTDVPSVGERHGITRPMPMPRLDEIGQKNIYYRSFITHQRGTNRGLYTSLCGGYPKLTTATAKMTELASGPDLDCLPAVLRRNGYETVFLQAAPLAFMLKDAFMPRAGFSQTLGDEQFTTAYARSFWGVDDRAFFEKSREKVKELRSRDKPWMMTLLTVGTHHPYPVPDDFASDEPHETYDRAARYADGAIAEFVRALEEDGVLEDTIVLITSDESHGLELVGDDLTKLLAQNLSFLIAIVPGRPQKAVDELFVQSDTSLSILDAVGLTDEAGSFVGRSVFRSYAEQRRIFIANQYSRTVGMVDSTQRVVWSCDETLVTCDRHDLGEPTFLSAARRSAPAELDEVAFIQGAQLRAAGKEVSPYRELRLTSERTVRVEDPVWQLLYAGQYLDLPPNVAVDVDLELSAIGDAGELSLTSDLVNERGTHALAKESVSLKGGQSAVLRYTFRNEGPLRSVEARAIAQRVGDREIALRITRATLSIRAAEWGDDPGVKVRERTVRSQTAVD